MKPGATGLKRVVDAAGYSMLGFQAAWRHEAAFRQELMLVLILFPAGVWLGQNGVERALLIGSLLLVLVVELLNSALEAVVDRIGPERHPLSGRAKDLGSAAVLVALINTVLIWSWIAWERWA
ncbi:MAG: diacylglycerol kinase [Magnetococcales bacterium]|nr:diacylglycerol kinase [Magnetococcales bacterium]NGZ04946.1 diacylglycerol kinase [Magnetococcales bacterium]